MAQGTPSPENAPETPEKDAAATPVASGPTPAAAGSVSAPAAPEAPAPAPEVLDPLWQNEVPTDLKPRSIPKATNTLERENNYSKNEDIRNLINLVRSGQWELGMRTLRYEAAHGRDILGTIRGFLAGEGRAEVDEATGEIVIRAGDIRYDPAQCDAVLTNWQNETIRKVANESLKTLTTVGMVALLTLLFSGTVAVSGPAVLGALLGRSVIEAIRSAASGERNFRQDLEAARISYFKKARNLANDIPDEYTPELAGDTPREVYITNRNNKIKSLVDYVHSYEALCVKIERTGAHDRHGRPSTHGAPFIDTERRGTEPVPSSGAPEQPMQPTDVSGPDFVYGTENIQHSDVAPDAVRIRELEDQIMHRKKFWDILTEVGGATAGIAASVYSLVNGGLAHLQGNMFNHMTDDLAHGRAVEHIGMGGDKLGYASNHAVQKIGDNLVYLYHSVQERLGSLGAHAHESVLQAANGTVQRIGEFGAHALNVSANSLELQQAFITEASNRVYEQLSGVLAALIAKAGISIGITDAEKAHFSEFREQERKKAEQERRRKQPDTLTINETLKQEAGEAGIHFPEVGDYYLYMKDPSLDPETPGNELRYKIKEIYANGSALIRIIRPGIKELFNQTKTVQIVDLIRTESPAGAHYIYLLPAEEPEEAAPKPSEKSKDDKDKDKEPDPDEPSPSKGGGSSDDDEDEDGETDDDTPKPPTPSSDEDEEEEEGGEPDSEPEDIVASEDEHVKEKESTEKGELNNPHFETAAARRTHEGRSPHETYWFDNGQGDSQVLVSLHKPESDKDMSLKDIAARVSARFTDAKPNYSDAAEIRNALKLACEATARDFNISPTNNEFSWSIVLLTKTGKFYGYRFHNDKSDVFQVSGGDVVIKSRESRETKGHKDDNARAEFYGGDLADNEKLALLDGALSANVIGNGSERFTIYDVRKATLLQDKSSRDLVDELLEKVADGYPNYEELCGIVTKYKKTPENEGPEKKIEVKLYKDGEPEAEKHELKNNSVLRLPKVKLKEGDDRENEIFPRVVLNRTSERVLVYIQYIDKDKKVREYPTDETTKVKSFAKIEDFQNWLDKYKVEFAANSPEELQAAIDAGSKEPEAETHEAGKIEAEIQALNKELEKPAPKIRAIGDIHGDLEHMNEAIDENADKIIFTGDFIDRGSNNKGVLNRLKELVEKGKAEFIFGNHELMFLGAMDGDPFALNDWAFTSNGGRETLKEFGFDIIPFRDKMVTASNNAAAAPDGSLEQVKLLKEFAAVAKEVIEALRQNQEIVGWYNWLKANGKFSVIHDSVLYTHADPLDKDGNLIDVNELLELNQSLHDNKLDFAHRNFYASDFAWNRMTNLAKHPLRSGQTDKIIFDPINQQLGGKYHIERIVHGHTPTGIDDAADDKPAGTLDGAKIINIDSGISEHYGGDVSYLDIDSNGIRFTSKTQNKTAEIEKRKRTVADTDRGKEIEEEIKQLEADLEKEELPAGTF